VPKNHQSGEKDPQHMRRRHGNPQLTYVFEMAAQVNQCMRRGRFFLLFQRLSKKLGVPKALTAVAHRLCFVAYGILRNGTLFEGTYLALYAEKRRRLSKRAKESVSPASLHSVIDTLLAQQGLTGAPT
jgi:hypothetical protein